MEFNVEEISPVKKKIAVSVAPEEVTAAIAAAVAVYRENARIDGFRKGKVPANVVERRFHDSIYKEAREDIINAHINEITQSIDALPVSGIDIKGAEGPLEKGKPYNYTMEFEVMPKFDLPRYEGLEAQEEKAVASEKNLESIILRLRTKHGKIIPVDGNAPGVDGQIVNIDFEGFIDGQPVQDLKERNFDLELGCGEALPEFENLVKGIPVGHTGEKEITFPEDFLNEDLAGKTVRIKLTVHAVKERHLASFDAELAEKLGFEDLDTLKESLKEDYLKAMQDLNKSATQKKLLDGMLKLTDFPLPPSLVNMQKRFLLTDLSARLERQGKSLHSLGKSLKELMDDMQPQAEEMARSQVLLLAIAKKEGLEVQEKEIDRQIFISSLRNGQNYRTMREEMERSGMIFQLRDRLLMDKAMDIVYAKANVTMVEPEDKTAAEPAASSEDGAGENANDAAASEA